MKKIVKKFWWIAALLVTLCSLFFGITTHIVNVRLDNEIAIMQEAHAQLEPHNADLHATLQHNDAELAQLLTENAELKKK